MSQMADRPSGSNLVFHIQELFSRATKKPFVVAYLSCNALPKTLTLVTDKEGRFELKEESLHDALLVFQLFLRRKNDDGYPVTTYLGSATVDISQCSKTPKYRLTFKDASSRPPLQTGQITIQFTQLPPAETSLQAHQLQSPNFARNMFNAAESNLRLIEGFGVKGLQPIVDGLHWVHSPYYVNHMGMTLPSGAFCMISTYADTQKMAAIRSYKQRLVVALARNTITTKDFIDTTADMMENSIKSKHLRCLAVVADMLTLHTRLDVRYTPDVQLTPESKGTERWEIPREPAAPGQPQSSFTGDCEDFAREVYQHVKELREWIVPKLNDNALESFVAILHLYVPTIEQGAVNSNAHSKYITYDAPYRNHIWAALHPRDAWRTKCKGNISLESMYAQWPRQPCEKTLPMVHLEGTGEVYPVVTARKPGFIAIIQQKKKSVLDQYPELRMSETPDMSLQCEHQSKFYKYAIACMTDIFADQNILDFTYVTEKKYGVSIYDWARGKYHFQPSTIHSDETMQQVRSALTIERPIYPITTTSKVVLSHAIKEGYSLRFGQKERFESVPKEAGYAVYKVGEQSWYELYFVVGGTSFLTTEMSDLMLI